MIDTAFLKCSDFIGKSDEVKPIEDVGDGDTFYEVDTKKTYIYYDGTWYEM